MYLKKTDGITINIASHAGKKLSLLDILYVMGEKRELEELFDPIILGVINNTKRSEDPLSVVSFAFSRDLAGLTEKQKIQSVRNATKTKILPFLGTDLKQKCYFLIDAASKLAKCALGTRKVTDERSLECKRIANVGILFYDMIQKYAHDQIEKMNTNLAKITDIFKLFDKYGGLLTNKSEYHLKTGIWFRLNQGFTRKVKRADSKLNASVIIKRINIPTPRKCKDIEYRLIHGSKYGFVCMASTPEGHQIGLLVSPSVTSVVTLQGDYDEWFKYLSLIPPSSTSSCKLKLNERFINYVDQQQAYEYARAGKRNLDPHASVIVDIEGDIIVDIDEGRMVRPLIVYGKEIPPEDSWEDLLRKGIVEYLDPSEQRNAFICLNNPAYRGAGGEEEYTHLELHDANMFSLEAASIPFSNHNQGPRLQLASVMNLGGIDIEKIDCKDDKENTYRLWYSQKPLCHTFHSRHLVKETNGINANVAVAALDYNQEDSCMISERFVQFAGLSVDCFHALSCKLPNKTVFGKPEAGLPNSTINRDYSKIESDGIIAVGAIVRNGTVLATKIRTSDGKHVGDFVYYDSTPRPEEEIYGEDLKDKPKNLFDKDKYLDETRRHPVYVDKIRLLGTKTTMLTVQFRQTRLLVPGDKIASRHSQKNIVSRIVSVEDMPFTTDGLVPDIIVNPHMLPSRVTIGQPIESLCSKLNALEPLFSSTICDATAFSSTYDLDSVQKELGNRGYSPVDTHRFFHPFTGEMIDTPIVMGLVYYMRLPQFVADKISARSDGAIVEKTRQPVKGRSSRGGQRCGEMEEPAFVAHGAGKFAFDKLVINSDLVTPYICNDCGIPNQTNHCICGNTDLAAIPMSYGVINLQRYVGTANIDLKFHYHKKLKLEEEDPLDGINRPET
jgi:DNA-directed RNA polymerase beta subunit